MKGTKTCPECGETKPTSQFYTDISMADSRSKLCKACFTAKYQRHRDGHGSCTFFMTYEELNNFEALQHIRSAKEDAKRAKGIW